MQLRQLTLAIPSESLAEIPAELEDFKAANLLAAWTALWHPVLLSEARTLPVAAQFDTLAKSLGEAGQLVLVPEVVPEASVDAWQMGDALAPSIRKFAHRHEIISQLESESPVDFTTPPPFADDFFALGFAYFQLERLHRSVRYGLPAEDAALREAVIAAADAAVAGDEQQMATHVEQAYDQLMQRRNQYYPIDFYLIDLSLVATTTVGEAFIRECKSATEHSVLVTGELLDHLAEHYPDLLAALRQAVDEKRITVCGGSMSGARLADLGPEQLLADLTAGQCAAERHLGRRLNTFAHHAGPFAPLVPGILNKLGYHAAVLGNFSGEPVPKHQQSRTTWTGLDGTPLEALAAVPNDMGSSSAMLALGEQMQAAMNYDLSAAILLVGWPGHRTEWYHDLKLVTQRSPLLGRPITLEDYFDSTTGNDYSATLSADRYPAAELTWMPGDKSDRWSALADLVISGGADADCLARALGASTSHANGTLSLNAASVPLGTGETLVPAFGWRWKPDGNASERPPRCEPGVLRNEYMELVFDERTGGISATRWFDRRGNFLSQHLAIAAQGPQGIAAGLQLAVDGWEVAESSDRKGVLTSRFRVVNRDGKTMANVEQRTTLAADSTSIDLQVKFEPTGGRPPSCAIASRIALREEDFAITRGLQGIDLPCGGSQVAAEWIGISSPQMPIAVLCDDICEHRQHSRRMLDTTLTEATGQDAVASLSYVLDCRYPAQAMAVRAVDDWERSMRTSAPRQPSGWWLRVGAKNLLVTHVESEILDRSTLLRLRVLETAGRPVSTTLAAWCDIVSAQQMNFLGEPDQLLSVTEGAVQLSFAAYEFAELEMLLASHWPVKNNDPTNS